MGIDLKKIEESFVQYVDSMNKLLIRLQHSASDKDSTNEF